MRPANKSRSGPTIKDIASALGVSHATVSRALNDSPLIGKATKERVRIAATEMGYIPDAAAKVMRGAQSKIVGFILPDVENHFYSAIARVIAETVAASGMQLVLAISEDDPDLELRHVTALCEARTRGIIITPVAELRDETAALLNNVACKQLVRRHPKVNADVVVADDTAATYLATTHLLARGHRRIAYIGGGAETLSTGVDRVQGYRRAMLQMSDASPWVTVGPPKPDFGYQAAISLLGHSEPPSAIVLGSSQLTLGTLKAIREHGLAVPGELSLIGYDDPDWFEYWAAGITTIALPIREMALMAASQVCGANPQQALVPEVLPIPDTDLKRLVFPVRLIQRGSDAPVNDPPRAVQGG